MKTETDVYVPKQWLLKAEAMLHQFMQGSILHWEHMSSDGMLPIHFAYLYSKLNCYFIKSLNT